MPRTTVLLFQEKDGTVPLLEWIEGLPSKVVAKCQEKIDRLKECGHELRRPEADFLRDGIHELRIQRQQVNYRMLYFFHGREAVVISHGLVKERKVPAGEINAAIRRKELFEKNPTKHTYRE